MNSIIATRRVKSGVLTVLSATALALGLVALPAHAVDRYVAVPLGTLGGATARGVAINAAGDVTGASYTAEADIYHAFLFSKGAMTDLGALSVANPLYSVLSYGTAINARGEVAGWSATGAANGYTAFVYAAGRMTALGSPSGIPATYAWGINDLGQAVGIEIAGTQTRPVLFTGSGTVDLGTLGGTHGEARGINARGQITGTAALTGDAALHAVVWSGGVIVDLGTLGGTYSSGDAINASGHVTGRAGLPASGGTRAFIYAAGRMVDLGTLGGSNGGGLAIDDRDVVVGWSDTADELDTSPRAFIHVNGRMFDLNQLVVAGLDGKLLTEATGINAGGQVVANACPRPFLVFCTAFRLDPIAAPATVAEVPATSRGVLAAMILLVMAGAWALGRRRPHE